MSWKHSLSSLIPAWQHAHLWPPWKKKCVNRKWSIHSFDQYAKPVSWVLLNNPKKHSTNTIVSHFVSFKATILRPLGWTNEHVLELRSNSKSIHHRFGCIQLKNTARFIATFALRASKSDDIMYSTMHFCFLWWLWIIINVIYQFFGNFNTLFPSEK